MAISAIARLFDSGQRRLYELGYKQELKRELTVVTNFAITFAIMSILAGVTPLYNIGLSYGGPIAMIYGWIIASIFNTFVSLSMAEICSVYPTSGGLYFWSYKLAGEKWGPFAAWVTGWFNIVGQWAATTSTDYSLAMLLQVIILLSTGGSNGGYLINKYQVLAIHGGLLFLHAALNSLPINWLSQFGKIAVLWNIIGVFVLMVLIPVVSPTRASANFVFTHFNVEESFNIKSDAYIFIIGLLMAQYSFIGFDAAAHMSEETKSSDKNGPYSIISTVVITIIVGYAYVVGVTFAVTDLDHVLDINNDAHGYAIAQVFYDAFLNRYGSGTGGIVCLAVVGYLLLWLELYHKQFQLSLKDLWYDLNLRWRILDLWLLILGDGAVPFSERWHVVNKWEVPLNAVWLSASISFLMAVPSLGSSVAFQAMVSIASVGLFIAYALPCLFRVTLGRKSFVAGPFNLGSWGVIIGWLAVFWVALITILLSLPVVYPVRAKSLNYTPVAVGCTTFLIMASWFVSAKTWFKGPIPNVDDPSPTRD